MTGVSAGADRADVALLAGGRDGFEAARSEVEDYGRRALVLPTEVSDLQAVEQAALQTESELVVAA